MQAKNDAANAKLRQMVKDQQEAEKKKVQSQEIQTEIEKQKIQIAEKTKVVMQDLALVEPAVIDAQQGNIVITFVLFHQVLVLKIILLIFITDFC